MIDFDELDELRNEEEAEDETALLCLDGEWACSCDYFKSGRMVDLVMHLRGAVGVYYPAGSDVRHRLFEVEIQREEGGLVANFRWANRNGKAGSGQWRLRGVGGCLDGWWSQDGSLGGPWRWTGLRLNTTVLPPAAFAFDWAVDTQSCSSGSDSADVKRGASSASCSTSAASAGSCAATLAGSAADALSDEDEEWPMETRDRAAWAGVQCPSQDTEVSRYLCRWEPFCHADDEAEETPLDGVRLALASMMRGVDRCNLESWIAWYISLGFQLLLIFFDDPEDPLANFAEGWPQVRAQRCTQAFWEEELARQLVAIGSADMACENRFRHKLEWYRSGCQMGRQAVVVDCAIHRAAQEGCTWLAHLDADELLYFPRPGQQADARRFFAAVPGDVGGVLFHNLECVPETFETESWFEEVSLFKVSRFLLDDIEDSAFEQAASALAEGGGKISTVQAVLDKPHVAHDRAIAAVRSRQQQVAAELGVALPTGEWTTEEERAKRAPSGQQRPQQRPGEGKEAQEGYTKSFRIGDSHTLFNMYQEGKSCVRLPRVHLGEDLFGGICQFEGKRLVRGTLGRLRYCYPDDAHAPVVLHYGNCGFSTWVNKYRLLLEGPRGGNSIPTHVASRELVRSRRPDELERFYRAYTMLELEDEGRGNRALASLTRSGIVVRVRRPRQLLRAWRRGHVAPAPRPPPAGLEPPPARRRPWPRP